MDGGASSRYRERRDFLEPDITMTLDNIATLLDSRIILAKGPADGPRTLPSWSAELEGVKIKEGSAFTAVYGIGDTPQEALDDYCARIAGKVVSDRSAWGKIAEGGVAVEVPQEVKAEAVMQVGPTTRTRKPSRGRHY